MDPSNSVSNLLFQLTVSIAVIPDETDEEKNGSLSTILTVPPPLLNDMALPV